MTKKIYVGKLASTTTDKDLQDHFSTVGTVITTKITKKIGFASEELYGYITMENEAETKLAIQKLNNSVLKGSRIKVIEAHPLDQEKPVQYGWTRRKKY